MVQHVCLYLGKHDNKHSIDTQKQFLKDLIDPKNSWVATPIKSLPSDLENGILVSLVYPYLVLLLSFHFILSLIEYYRHLN